MKDLYIDHENFKKGLQVSIDTTKADYGSARRMDNCRITDRGGVAPRKGTVLLGSDNQSDYGCTSLFSFRKSFGQDEILVKTYGTEKEIFSKNHPSAGWFRLKSGYTAGSEHGYAVSLVNTDNTDYLVSGNRHEPFERWNGAVTVLDGALSGGETSVVVESTLIPDIYQSETATGSSATSLTVASASWATDQWIGFHVLITSGALSGKTRRITDSDGTSITFSTLGGDPGSCSFEIRKAAFPDSGTIIYAGTDIAYSAIDTSTSFTVSSAHAASDGAGVALVPQEFEANPRGNRFANYLSRIIVGNVRSAIARDSGGSLQGYASAGSYFVSELNDPASFDFSATRAAGEGDIISTPYGGGDITDVIAQEDAAYVFKESYIESVKYSQDENDLAVREPLKAEIGAVHRTIKGSDDVYFMTADKRFTSLGRVSTKDIKPQTEDIGDPIHRYLETLGTDLFTGIEYRNRILFSVKSDPLNDKNDITIVYNKNTKSFEGVWDIGAAEFAKFDGGRLHYAESTGANVLLMDEGNADVYGATRFPIIARYATNWMNLTSSKGHQQALNSMYFEGYIKGETSIEFKAWKDFSDDPFLSFTFSGDESAFLDGGTMTAALGSKPVGLRPLGTVSDADPEGWRHFQFRVYFPFQYGNFFSIGHESSGADLDYEITRYGLSVKEDVSMNQNRVKAI